MPNNPHRLVRLLEMLDFLVRQLQMDALKNVPEIVEASRAHDGCRHNCYREMKSGSHTTDGPSSYHLWKPPKRWQLVPC